MRVPHTAGSRVFLSSPPSAGSRLLRASMYPRAQPTEAPPACNTRRPLLHHLRRLDRLLRQQRPAHRLLEEDVWEGLVVEAISCQHEGFDEHGGGAVVRQARLFIRGHSQQLGLQIKTGEPVAIQ